FDPEAPSNVQAYGEPRYVAYILRAHEDVRWKDLGPAKEVDNAVALLRSALGDPKRKDVQELARRADEKIMQPVRPLLGEATRLLISPYGALNLIPFESLVDEDGRYLVERFSISYLTAGRDLLRMQVPRMSKNAPLVV